MWLFFFNSSSSANFLFSNNSTNETCNHQLSFYGQCHFHFSNQPETHQRKRSHWGVRTHIATSIRLRIHQWWWEIIGFFFGCIWLAPFSILRMDGHQDSIWYQHNFHESSAISMYTVFRFLMQTYQNLELFLSLSSKLAVICKRCKQAIMILCIHLGCFPPPSNKWRVLGHEKCTTLVAFHPARWGFDHIYRREANCPHKSAPRGGWNFTASCVGVLVYFQGFEKKW